MSKNKPNLIVGAGLSGATLAHLLATVGKQKVILIDRKDHLAGNCYDYRDHNGIMIQRYGAHIFHTNSKEVWDFVGRFARFNTYMHQVLGVIDGITTHIPFNLNTLHEVFPQTMAVRLEEKLLKNYSFNQKVPILEFKRQQDRDLQALADYVYEKIFKNYTQKQWGRAPDAVDGAVTARVPVYLSRDNRYFQDIYQGIPLKGYTGMVKNMLDHPNIEVRLNEDFAAYRKAFFKQDAFKRIFYSGSIDEFFEYRFGVLPYRSVKFMFEEHKLPYYQQNACINYPNNYDFTRIHEFKYFLNDQSPNTVIAKEYSEAFELGKNERFYPIPHPEHAALYQKYKEAAATLDKVFCLGRLGDYCYYNMDAAIERALTLFKSLKLD